MRVARRVGGSGFSEFGSTYAQWIMCYKIVIDIPPHALA